MKIDCLKINLFLGYGGTRYFRVLQNPKVPQGKVLKNSERNSELFNSIKIGYFNVFSEKSLFSKYNFFLNSVTCILCRWGGSNFFNLKSPFSEKNKKMFCCFWANLIHKSKIFECSAEILQSSEERSEFPRYPQNPNCSSELLKK